MVKKSIRKIDIEAIEALTERCFPTNQSFEGIALDTASVLKWTSWWHFQEFDQKFTQAFSSSTLHDFSKKQWSSGVIKVFCFTQILLHWSRSQWEQKLAFIKTKNYRLKIGLFFQECSFYLGISIMFVKKIIVGNSFLIPLNKLSYFSH